MSLGGYCRICGQYVYVTEQWACVNGHAWSELSGWYDTGSGAAVTPPWVQPAVQPMPMAPPSYAPAAAGRLNLLTDILTALGQYPSLKANYGTKSDIVIDNQILDAKWVGGKKTVEYAAAMKAVESERALYLWEILKEGGAGADFGGFEAETYSTSGMARSGKQRMMIVGSNGVPIEWEWDYAATRKVIEDVARSHGWSIKSVLQKKSAEW